MGAERRRPGGADPLAAALMPRLLLGEPSAQCLHQLLPAAERLDQLLLFLGQEALRKLLQPRLRDLRLRIRQGLDTLEAVPEDPVEPIKMPLVFDERCARKKIEILDVKGG